MSRRLFYEVRAIVCSNLWHVLECIENSGSKYWRHQISYVGFAEPHNLGCFWCFRHVISECVASESYRDNTRINILVNAT